jgi:hypothetical protein
MPRLIETDYRPYRSPDTLAKDAAQKEMMRKLSAATTLREIIDAVMDVPAAVDSMYIVDLNGDCSTTTVGAVKRMFTQLETDLALAQLEGKSIEEQAQLVYAIARIFINPNGFLPQFANKLFTIGLTGYSQRVVESTELA